jgi:2'-5' RNA ligase/GNAT superfamily N-acetyltransferase
VARRHVAVALVLRGRAALEIDALRHALGDPDAAGIPTHLTLVPPVNVRDAELGAVLATLRSAAATTPPLTLALGPPTTFLPVSPTLYLPVAGDLTPLTALRDALRVGPLDRPDAHPFVPHVTLLNPAPPDVLTRAEATLAGYRTRVTVAGMSLLEETDHVWRPVADAAFGATGMSVGRGSLALDLSESDVLDPEAAAFAAREWEAYDEARFGPGTRWVRDPFAVVARRDGDVVGVASGWTGQGVTYLAELLVASTVRGEGVGGHLLRRVEAVAIARESPRLALRTDAGSDALGFYEHRGWVVEATFEDWLGGRRFVQLRRDL